MTQSDQRTCSHVKSAEPLLQQQSRLLTTQFDQKAIFMQYSMALPAVPLRTPVITEVSILVLHQVLLDKL